MQRNPNINRLSGRVISTRRGTIGKKVKRLRNKQSRKFARREIMEWVQRFRSESNAE